jgi:hypothetical protein
MVQIPLQFLILLFDTDLDNRGANPTPSLDDPTSTLKGGGHTGVGGETCHLIQIDPSG